MTFIKNTYLTRKPVGAQSNNGKQNTKQKVWRNWWLVKYQTNNKNIGTIHLGTITIPEEYVGKRVRFKIEVIEDDT